MGRRAGRRGALAVALIGAAAMLAVAAPSASAIPTIKSTFGFTKAQGETYTGKVVSKNKACVRGRTVIFKRGATTIATKTSSKRGKVVLTAADQAATPFELAHVLMTKKKIGKEQKSFCASDQATIDKRGSERAVSVFGDNTQYNGDRTFSITLTSTEPQCISGRTAFLYKDLSPLAPGTSTAAGLISITLDSTPTPGSYVIGLTNPSMWWKVTGGGDLNLGPCQADVGGNPVVLETP